MSNIIRLFFLGIWNTFYNTLKVIISINFKLISQFIFSLFYIAVLFLYIKRIVAHLYYTIMYEKKEKKNYEFKYKWLRAGMLFLSNTYEKFSSVTKFIIKAFFVGSAVFIGPLAIYGIIIGVFGQNSCPLGAEIIKFAYHPFINDYNFWIFHGLGIYETEFLSWRDMSGRVGIGNLYLLKRYDTLQGPDCVFKQDLINVRQFTRTHDPSYLNIHQLTAFRYQRLEAQLLSPTMNLGRAQTTFHEYFAVRNFMVRKNYRFTDAQLGIFMLTVNRHRCIEIEPLLPLYDNDVQYYRLDLYPNHKLTQKFIQDKEALEYAVYIKRPPL